MYERVSDRAQMRQIETLSVNWCLYGYGRTYGYYILCQLNAHDKQTGYYKIIRKEKAECFGWHCKKVQAYSEDDWEYFEKRGQ